VKSRFEMSYNVDRNTFFIYWFLINLDSIIIEFMLFTLEGIFNPGGLIIDSNVLCRGQWAYKREGL